MFTKSVFFKLHFGRAAMLLLLILLYTLSFNIPYKEEYHQSHLANEAAQSPPYKHYSVTRNTVNNAQKQLVSALGFCTHTERK